MAATYAGCECCRSPRTKEAHRLGSRGALGFAKTWATKAEAYVSRDGSGYVEVRTIPSGEVLHRFDFGPEDSR